MRKAALLCREPTCSNGLCCKSFADELASTLPNVVVEAEKDKLQVGFRQVCTRIRDDGLVISSLPTGRTRLASKFKTICDNRCTFCIVWKARGAGKSLDPREDCFAGKDAMSRGQEVVLTGNQPWQL